MDDKTLYAFFELGIAPPAYNFTNFLVLADIAREQQGLDNVHVVIVPGSREGYRAEDIEYPVINKDWRLRQLVISAVCLLPTSKGHTHCGSREQAARLHEEARHVFPEGYAVDRPRADHDYITVVRAAKCGHRIDRLRAPAQAKIYVRQWLDLVAGGRRVVTITLRQSNYDVHRSSTLSNWVTLGHEMMAQGFLPVFVRDTERVFDSDPAELEGLPEFPLAAVNLELRAALYEEAYLNTGINQGPWTLWHFLESIPYLCVYVVDRMFDGWSDYHIDGSGFTIGKDMPFARGCQRTYWGDDHLDDLRREFAAIIERLEAGEHDAPAHAGNELKAETPLEVALRYQQNGQLNHALAIYKDVLSQNPQNLQAMLYGAITAVGLEDFALATEWLSTVSAQVGPDAMVLRYLARAYAGLGQSDKALSVLDDAVQALPEEAELHQSRGDLLMDLGRADESLASYRELSRCKPGDKDAIEKLAAACLAVGRIEEALQLRTSIVRGGSFDAANLEGLAQSLRAVGRTDEAAVCFEASLAAYKGEDVPVDRLAHVLRQLPNEAA